MALIKAFKGIRPIKEYVHLVPSKPYDVLNSEEAREEAKDNPWSFLRVVKSEIDLPENTDPYSPEVYQTARENFLNLLEKKAMKKDPEDYLYVYRQVMNGKAQTGIIACSHIDDYFNDVIKKHEFTRPVKEKDRINHIRTTKIHAGPVFLTYPDVEDIDKIVRKITENQEPEYSFTAEMDVEHILWVIRDKTSIEQLINYFNSKVPFTYIADGHHRAASSALVGKELRDNNPDHKGDEEYNYFLSVLFPANQLNIIDYNRVVKDLNALDKKNFLSALNENFEVTDKGNNAYKPDQLHNFGMYLDNKWYHLKAKPGLYKENDPVNSLDVSILQKYVLDELLGIKDPRTDERIDFIGGIRGLSELEKLVDSGKMKVAFALYPVTIQQLIDISNSGNVMPPKSTWFEPKLKSGLVVHEL